MKNWFIDLIVILFYAAIAAVILGVCFGIVWLIATSNLPDWVKFALLK